MSEETIDLTPEIRYHPTTGKKIYFYSIFQMEEWRRVARMNDASLRDESRSKWNGWHRQRSFYGE